MVQSILMQDVIISKFQRVIFHFVIFLNDYKTIPSSIKKLQIANKNIKVEFSIIYFFFKIGNNYLLLF